MLLQSGDHVYVDKASVIGGLEVGESKMLNAKWSQYVSTVTYAEQPSYVSEMKSDSSFDPSKKE